MKHYLEWYLDRYTTLTPVDTQVGAAASADWWAPLKAQFDEIIWMYYPEFPGIFCNYD